MYRKSDLTRDTDLLKAILRAAEQLAKLSIHYEGNERNFEPDLRISVPPEEQFLLPSLRTITTTRCVSPQELLRCFPCVQTAEFKRMLPEDDALVAVAGLQGSHITDLTISVERLSVRFLEDVGKLANLVYLQLTTCVPHRHPWSNNKEDLGPRALGVSRPRRRHFQGYLRHYRSAWLVFSVLFEPSKSCQQASPLA